MSVEVAPIHAEHSIETVLDLSEAEIYAMVEGIEAASTKADAKKEEMSFAEIAKLFLDSQDERVNALRREKQELIVGKMLDNPTEAFLGEFLQLQLLYRDRTMNIPRYDGGMTSEFCTQNHERERCDYLFRYTKQPDGRESYRVNRVFLSSGEPERMELVWRDRELSVVKHAYYRGRTKEIELKGDRRERILAEFFYDTIHASALQIERNAIDREDNDHRARGYLKTVRDNEYLLI